MPDTSLLFSVFLTKPLWMWLIFGSVVFTLLAFDLGVLHKKDHEIGTKESLVLSAIYIGIGLLYGGFIWVALDQAKALEYFTGFIVEKTLSIDNVFVIALLFSFFHIPRLHQHRVLFWGILGALVLRGLMIGFGAALVERFEWILYFFAAFLLFTGVKMLFSHEEKRDIADNPLLGFMKRHFRVTHEMHGSAFFVRQPSPKTGQPALFLTPLFLCLVMVEFTDLLFAVDSVPAIFVITADPFIVYTSNIFAILGLRALYFVLVSIVQRFHYLKHALSLVLVFIGSKTFIAYGMGWEKFPVGWSLGITFAILGTGILYSLFKTRAKEEGIS